MKVAAWLPAGGRERAERLIAAALTVARAQLRREWASSWTHRALISRPRPHGLAAAPVDFRPGRPTRGLALLAGRFVLDGQALDVGQGGDPWNRPAPSRGFAMALHGMDWMPDLLSVEHGPRAALSLALGWQAVYGRWNAFSWSGAPLERRVYNLACAARPLLVHASESEAQSMLDVLARQARHLLVGDGPEGRAAERAAAAGTAACALAGPAGETLLSRALLALEPALQAAVLPDGTHASRSAQTALELLFDLHTLDQALEQRGRSAPAILARALDRLAGALPALVLPDGRLPALQGSEPGDPERIDAALAGVEPILPTDPVGGFVRVAGKRLQILLDVAPPAQGLWSETACAQPLAIEVLAGRERLITAAAWTARAEGTDRLRLAPAASTATVSDESCGKPLAGRLARLIGPRLTGAPQAIRRRRRETDDAIWLELSHDGWAEAFGLVHERRLYLDRKADDLRGEDSLIPTGAVRANAGAPLNLVVRFLLHPDVKAQVALDHHSVLLQPPSGGGWWLRNDAARVAVEPAVHLDDGRMRQTSQIVLRRPLDDTRNARIRWKLGVGGA